MKEDNKFLADVWGDTVDVRHLLIAVIISIVICLTFFTFGLKFLQTTLIDVAPNLIKAYALLIGLAGSVLSAVISGVLFKPKRVLNEMYPSEEDRLLVLEELGINREQEVEALKHTEKQIIEEMKSLKLYEIFTDVREEKKEVL